MLPILFHSHDCYSGTMRHVESGFPVEHPDQDMGTQAKNALITALLFIAYVAVATFVLATILYFRLTWCLYGYFVVALTVGLTTLTISMLGLVFATLNWPMDWFTAGFITWNFVISGT